MDERNRNPKPNPQTEPPRAEVIAPTDGEQNMPVSNEIGLEAETAAVTSEIASAPPRSIAPVTASSSLSFLERYWKFALIMILVLAVALRTRGLDWDEGQHLHPDERFLTMVETAIQLPSSLGQYFDTAQSPLNPYNQNFGSFVYGTAPLFFVRLTAELIGQTDYERVVLVGRALSALADVIVLLITFAVGRRLYGLRVGLLAALLYAASVLPIKQSHFFTVDTFTNVPLMLAFWFTLDIAEGKRGWWAFLLAGSCFGLMLASRINLVPFAGIIALAALLRLARSLGEIRRMTVELSGLNVRQTFETRAPLAAPKPVEVRQAQPIRAVRIGPLLIEIEFKPDALAGSVASEAGREPVGSKAGERSSLRQVIVGLVLAAIAAILLFRVAQPYAFNGLFTPNPQFLDDMAKAQRVVSGEDDFPPSHQWTNRTPYWFAWYNLVFWGLGPMLGLAAWLGVGLAAVQLWRNQQWKHLLILFWVIGMFLYHGQQFVMTMRYLLPLYPFLAIFAAFFLFALWDAAKEFAQNSRAIRFAGSARLLAGMAFVVVVGATLFWAIASTSIYARTNTRIAASRWIHANIPDSAVVGNEHWDDSLPLRVDGQDFFRDRASVMLELYGEDTLEKRAKMVEWMDQVDYIFLSSNRLYGSIPRLPTRFPLTTKYYEWLFNGQLGFEPVKEFTSYPQFLGITIIDDHAEEAFTVYDHPKVIIFKKTPAYSHGNTVELFNTVDLTEVLRLKPIDAAASRRQFQMTSDALAANRAGGTWSDLFEANDVANRLPLPIWLAMVWLIGLLAFPFTFVGFRAFSDRGYAFAKALGILFVAWFAWMLSSYHILPFSRISIGLGLIVMAASGLLIVRRHQQEMRTFIRANLKLLLIEELIFFAFFAIDLAIRYGNPDLWHPSFGGEKPMDLAFLNAILKTTYFPPYNPWFAGNYINYYYFGQMISATLVRLSGILPEVAYNLLIPMFFALAASGAYGVVFNLVLSRRQQRKGEAQSPAEDAQERSLALPSIAGVFAAVLVLLLGNLGEVQLAVKGLTNLGGGPGVTGFIKGLNDWLTGGKTIPVPIGDWYWTATRVITDTINEFPFFTFLYGDLHAHLIAIPYTLVALGLATHVILNRAKLQWYDMGLIALVLGGLNAINTWDFPTYLGMIGVAMILGLNYDWKEQDTGERRDWHATLQKWLLFVVLILFQVVLFVVPLNILGIRVTLHAAIYLILLLLGVVVGLSQLGGNWDPLPLARTFGWRLLTMIGLSILLFLPYILDYATGYTKVELWHGDRTTLTEYLTVHGIFLFIGATFFVVTSLTSYLRNNTPEASELELTGWTIYLVPALIIAEIALMGLKLWVFAFLFPLIVLGIWLSLHPRTPIEARWATVLILVGLVLTLIVEVVILRGDVGRMNTVFKFYLQAWVIFGVAGASGLALIAEHLTPIRRVTPVSTEAIPVSSDHPPLTPTLGMPSRSRLITIRRVWWGALAVLISAGLLYTFAATRAKVNDRYVENSPPGLNGMNYMLEATYHENNQPLVLQADYDAIQWMRQNVKGSPVIVEANTGLYRWGNRFSIYTGLPTIIGWDWHTKQQYSLLPSDLIDRRIELVRELYNTPDPDRAEEILQRYEASYVIVGGLERAVYDAAGLSKFDQPSNLWSLVYQNEQVKIYRVH